MKEDKIKFMKKGILLIVIFLVIFIALNNYYVIKTSPKKNLDYAFFGDSHVRDGVNPQFIGNSFNFGVGEENYVEIYYKIKELLGRKLLWRREVEINNFVLQIDIHVFSDKFRTNKALSIEEGHYNKAIPLISAKKLKTRSISQLLKSKFPIIGNGRELIALSLYLDIVPTKLGWTNNTEEFILKNKEEAVSKRYNYSFSNPPNLLDNITLSYFLKILDLAKKNHIKIIFIKYPVTKEYDAELIKHNISKEDHYDLLFKEINKVAKDYVLLDYYDDFFDHPEYFGDPDHLNYIGSQILSKKIQEDLREMSLMPFNEKDV